MEKTFQSGEKIVCEGEIGSSAFWIKQGRVEVSRTIDGRRIVLAILDEKSPLFGEMSLIDEKPRSATVTAIETCIVQEITAELLHNALSQTPRSIQALVNLLVNRVRGMNELMLTAGINLVQSPITSVTLSDVGAARRLEEKEFTIARFPFKIGRRSPRDAVAFLQRDLVLDDEPPYNVSRAHCSIERIHEDIFVIDEGSSLGTIVNGCRIGGPSENNQMRCDKETNLIVLGTPHSPYQFSLAIQR